MLLAQAAGRAEDSAEQAADARFAAIDATNRADLITAYRSKMRARRGGRPQ